MDELSEWLNVLDFIVMNRRGDFDAAIETELGAWILSKVMEDEHRTALLERYGIGSINHGAQELKEKIKRLMDERARPQGEVRPR